MSQRIQEKDRQLKEKPIEAAAVRVVIPDEVRVSIYNKVASLYEGLLKLTETEIQIFSEDVDPDSSDDVISEISSAIGVLQDILFVITQKTEAT